MSGHVTFEGDIASNASAVDGSVILQSPAFQNVYRRCVEDGQIAWVNYMFIVKGQTVQKMVRQSMKDGICSIHGGFVVRSENAQPTDLTLKRLSACLLYENSKKSGLHQSDPPQGWDRATLKFVPHQAPGGRGFTGADIKYLPSMANLVPWARLAETITDEAVKSILLEKVKFMCGAGFSFCWRMYIKENTQQMDEAAVAFAIAAFFLDLGAVNNARRKENKPALGSAAALDDIALGNTGTLAALLTNCASLTPPLNIIDSNKIEIFNIVTAQDIKTVAGGGSSRRLKEFFNRVCRTNYVI